MLKLSIELDKSELNHQIKFASGVEDSIKAGLIKAMLFAEGEAKQNFGGQNQLKVRTGRLRTSITSGTNGLEGWIGTNVKYAPIHEFGGVIKPKNGKYLKFQIQGQWKTVKQVIIPKRPFLEPALVNNADKMVDIIKDEILEAFYK